MPGREEHCQHTLERYGVRGEDIHGWMDEPSLILGSEHRKERHDPTQETPQIFITKYGRELARNIILDHIFLDVKSVKGARAPYYTDKKFVSKIRIIEKNVKKHDENMDKIIRILNKLIGYFETRARSSARSS